jgi:hypothetical protein
VTLEARFHDRNDASFTVLISDEHTQVTEVSLKLPLRSATWGSPDAAVGSGDDYLTFNRYKNEVVKSEVLVKFDDGTQLGDVSLVDSIPDWCPLSSFVQIASSAPDSVPHLGGGRFAFNENHWDVVELTASAACNGSLAVESSPTQFYSNLLAPLDDVDLGQRTGLQFQQYGDTLEIAVRANV